MPNCPRCGQEFSSFSFGSSPATQWKDCRKITAAAAVTATPAQVKFTPSVIRAGNLNPGVAEMERAAALNTDLLFPPALLGELRLEQGNPGAAVPVLEHTMTLVPDAYYVQHNLALAYLGSGRPMDAMKEITSALQFEKTNPRRAQYVLALAAEQSEDPRLAAENLRSVIESKPDLKEARDDLVRLNSSVPSRTAFEVPYAKLAFKSQAWPLYP